MQHFNETSSDRIKEKIKEAGIKKVHLAQKLGISPQQLHNILSKNQERSQYLPKMAEILGVDPLWLETGSTKPIPILVAEDLKALAEGSVSFDDLSNIILKSWPSAMRKDYYIFCYELTEKIHAHLFAKDLLVFSSCIPINPTGKVGITYIKSEQLIFIGILKRLKNHIMIYNEHDCFSLNSEDWLFGVATHLERNIEKGV